MTNTWRQNIHLEAPDGWINDPNGLCFAGGKYHVYFQYSPGTSDGSSLRRWGHFESSDDGKSWDYTGVVMEPDLPEDMTGVFSGSAVVKDGIIHLFYTGNVEHPGNYDYVTSGREANQIHVTTTDGRSVSPKNVILRNSDYPDYCSCHVRDPKVWIENGMWKMVLGARTLEDKGCVLFYEAEDPDDWHFVKMLKIEDFGYMWECPDMFNIGGNWFLGLSPQGVPSEEFRYQNLFNSGYFKVDGDRLLDFEEFDYGFDFYAPQTFIDKNGDRILIGWMGIGDSSYTNPTTEFGWQHCLTVPRKLTVGSDGYIRQTPVINTDLYGEREEIYEGTSKVINLPSELSAKIKSPFKISIGDAVISYCGDVLMLDLSNGKSGYGRKIRKVRAGRINDIRIIADNSSIEIFAGDGRYVMSTRFYPAGQSISVVSEGAGYTLRTIGKMEVRGFD